MNQIEEELETGDKGNQTHTSDLVISTNLLGEHGLPTPPRPHNAHKSIPPPYHLPSP